MIPYVPTIAEVLGQPGFDSDTWTGFVAPAGTPPAVIQRLNQSVAYALEQNRESLQASGYLILGGSPEQMADTIKRELETLTPLIARIMKE